MENFSLARRQVNMQSPNVRRNLYTNNPTSSPRSLRLTPRRMVIDVELEPIEPITNTLSDASEQTDEIEIIQSESLHTHQSEVQIISSDDEIECDTESQEQTRSISRSLINPQNNLTNPRNISPLPRSNQLVNLLSNPQNNSSTHVRNLENFQLADDPIDIPSQESFPFRSQNLAEEIELSDSSSDDIIENSMTSSQQHSLQQIPDIKDLSESQELKELNLIGETIIEPSEPSELHDETIDTNGASQFFEHSHVIVSVIEDLTKTSNWSFGFSRILKVKVVETSFDVFQNDSEMVIITPSKTVKSLKDIGQTLILLEPFHAFPFFGESCFLVPNCSVSF